MDLDWDPIEGLTSFFWGNCYQNFWLPIHRPVVDKQVIMMFE